MGHRREAERSPDREPGKSHQLAFAYRFGVAQLEGGEGRTVDAEDSEIVLTILVTTWARRTCVSPEPLRD